VARLSILCFTGGGERSPAVSCSPVLLFKHYGTQPRLCLTNLPAGSQIGFVRQNLRGAMRQRLGILIVATMLAAGCKETGQPVAESPQTQMTAILEAVAAHTPAQRLGEVTWYGPDNLHEYIDGMAPYFTDSGFVRLAHSEWRAADAAGDAYVELDLYDMGSPEGALDVLCDSRTPGTVYLDIGSEAHRTEDGIELRAGRYYVKSVARRDVAGQQDLLKALAEAVAAAAPQGPSDDSLLAPLPAEDRLPHSAAYTTKGFLGREFLRGVREAAYDVNGKNIRLFVMGADDLTAAARVFQQWRTSLTTALARDEGPESFAYDEPYVGHVLVIRRGRYVAGAIGDPAAAQESLKRLLARLE